MATRNLEDEYLEMADHDILEDEQNANDLLDMTLVEHLEELRRRIFKSLIAVAICSVAAFIFRVQMMDFLTGPLPSTANAWDLAKQSSLLQDWEKDLPPLCY